MDSLIVLYVVVGLLGITWMVMGSLVRIAELRYGRDEDLDDEYYDDPDDEDPEEGDEKR